MLKPHLFQVNCHIYPNTNNGVTQRTAINTITYIEANTDEQARELVIKGLSEAFDAEIVVYATYLRGEG